MFHPLDVYLKLFQFGQIFFSSFSYATSTELGLPFFAPCQAIFLPSEIGHGRMSNDFGLASKLYMDRIREKIWIEFNNVFPISLTVGKRIFFAIFYV